MAIEITVGGVTYQDIVAAQVKAGLEQFARTFTLQLSDKYFQTERNTLPFAEGDACTIVVDGIEVLDGFIDELPIAYAGRQHSIAVSGRSWTGDLVDCSALHKTGSWRNRSMADIATDICAPFDIAVSVHPSAVDAASEPFSKWAIDDEETAQGNLARMAKLRGVFLLSGPGRELEITRAGTSISLTPLIKGVNILSGSRTGNFTERFSRYLVRTQRAGDDAFFGEDVTSKLATTIDDEGVGRYRPLVIVADGAKTKNDLEVRAKWERNVRAGQSRRYTYEVQGLVKEFEGTPWIPNELVEVSDPFFDFEGTMLVAGVTMAYNDKGSRTSLDLASPEAFEVLPAPPKRLNRRSRKPAFEE